MNPFQFLSQLDSVPGNSGDGVRVSRPLNILTDLRTTAGLVLTGATAPTVAAIETNALGVVVAASTTAAGSFVFQVPADYDETADELFINVLANSAGNTDQPTLDATVYRKRAGTALTADLAPTATAAIPKSASPTDDAAVRIIDLSGNEFLAGDVLTINLVTGAHTTDAVQIFGVEVVYRSSLVYGDITDRKSAI